MRVLRRVVAGLAVGAFIGYVVELVRPRRSRAPHYDGGSRGF